jgi:hypothetical protein
VLEESLDADGYSVFHIKYDKNEIRTTDDDDDDDDEEEEDISDADDSDEE